MLYMPVRALTGVYIVQRSMVQRTANRIAENIVKIIEKSGEKQNEIPEILNSTPK